MFHSPRVYVEFNVTVDVASPALSALDAEVLSFTPLLPPCPTRVDQVLLDDQIADAKRSSKPGAKHPFNPAGSAQIGGEGEPHESKNGAASTAD
ncbi:hypothetical protein OPT61_g7594 [Boeremia exigua]|uniref:Uncharacterized protein n=1 Tax=Boeremia exigua TaxID=749465 RepID=A0ACC2I267_9PLEO|nr:hypothetical protein OPT61_g7594 [Boeremia exigua]